MINKQSLYEGQTVWMGTCILKVWEFVQLQTMNVIVESSKVKHILCTQMYLEYLSLPGLKNTSISAGITNMGQAGLKIILSTKKSHLEDIASWFYSYTDVLCQKFTDNTFTDIGEEERMTEGPVNSFHN